MKYVEKCTLIKIAASRSKKIVLTKMIFFNISIPLEDFPKLKKICKKRIVGSSQRDTYSI